MIHLRTQGNLARGPASVEKLYVAYHLCAKLIPQYYIDDCNFFKLLYDDLRPQNMVIDPDTLRTTAVLDLEFTNAMPSTLVAAVGRGPRGRNYEAFVAAYKPRMERLVRAIEHEASYETMGRRGKKPLSSLMRESWDTGRFWNLSIWTSFSTPT